MANTSMSYETIMVFSTTLGEEGVNALSEKFKALIGENATVDKVEEWGKRRLAYPINDELEGVYLYVEFTSNPDFPAELDRVYKITDGVLRTLIVRKEEDNKKPGKKPVPENKSEPVPVPESKPEPVQEQE